MTRFMGLFRDDTPELPRVFQKYERLNYQGRRSVRIDGNVAVHEATGIARYFYLVKVACCAENPSHRTMIEAWWESKGGRGRKREQEGSIRGAQAC